MVKIGANSSQFRKEIAASQRQLRRAFGSEGMAASQATVDATGAAMGAISIAMGAVGVKAVKMAADMEQNRIAFETMLGSAQAANDFLQKLQVYAEKTPFTFDGLVTGSKRMLAMGFTVQEILPSLTAFGDAVAAVGGSTEVLDRVTLAFAQMKAKQRVSAEEMNQLAEAGIPAWEMLAKAIGTDVATAMDMAEKKAINGNTAIAGMIAQMSTKYGGMMQKQSQTITGIMSNIQDKASATMRKVGEDIVTAFDLKGVTTNALATLEEFSTKAKSMGIGGAMVDMVPASVEIAISGVTGALIARMIPAMYSAAIASTALGISMGPLMAIGAALGITLVTVAYQSSKSTAETHALADAMFTGAGSMVAVNSNAGELSYELINVGNSAIYAAKGMAELKKMEYAVNSLADFRRSEDSNKLPAWNTTVTSPTMPEIPSGGGAGGGSASDAMDELKEKAKSTTESIEREWVQLTKSELEQTDIWRDEQLATLEESKVANENYSRDVTRVNEMYAQKRIEIARNEASGIAAAMEEINNVRQGVANYSRGSSVLQDIENERQARIKAINDTTMAQVEKNTLIDQVNQQMWAKYEQYELSANSLHDTLQEIRYSGDLAQLQAFLTEDTAMRLNNYEAQQTMMDTYQQAYLQANATTSQLTADMYSTALTGLGTAFSDIITGAQSASDAFKSLGKSMLKVVADFVAKWIAGRIMMALFGEAAMGEQVLASALAGKAVALAWAPAAAMVSLASFGANSAPAMAGIGATVGLSMGLAGITGFATGGPISGPGTGTSDSILMWGSDGEYMVNAAATKSIGVDNLNYMNQTGQIPGFAAGGLVTGPSLSSLSSRYQSAGGLSDRILKKIGLSNQQPATVTQNNYGGIHTEVDLNDVMTGLGKIVTSAMRG
ncbi:tape measure domain-containing protein [Sporomusa malonica]|uniref:Tape measure domain-containing protein n=2 Tax=Sporomusa malonica TaxID=112901 RepID=A0A1W2ARG3_9FIRM|nr:tape measure domain-containing protein [Sporomusa malonica]